MEINPIVYEECAELILEKFSQLGIEEIKEAYRMWAAGELGEVKGAEMYGGVFNAAQMGKILARYLNRRKEVVGRYLTLKYDKTKEKMKAQKQAEQKAKYEEGFTGLLASWSGESWQDVPYHWFDTAKKRNMIHYAPGEKRQIWEKAQKAAKMEITTEQQEEENLYRKASLMKNLECNLEDRAIVIARKMTVFEKLLSKA